MVAGFAVSLFVIHDYENSMHAELHDHFKDVKNNILQLEKKMHVSSVALTEQQSLVSSVNFISEYFDISNYQPLVFDGEKKNVAALLSQYSRLAQVDHVKVYDANGWLVSFTDNEKEHFEQGYVSFVDGKPIIFARLIDYGDSWKEPSDPYWKNATRMEDVPAETNSYFVEKLGKVAIETVEPLFRLLPDNKKKRIGTVILTKYFTKEFFSNLSEKIIFRNKLVVNGKVVLGEQGVLNELDDLSAAPYLMDADFENEKAFLTSLNHYVAAYAIPLRDNNRFYLVSSLSKEIVNRQIQDTLLIIFFVFLLLIVITLPLGILFSNKVISKPVELLIKYAEKLKKGEYDFDVVQSQDDFGVLAETLRSASGTISSREEELKVAHATLEERVRERTRDLEIANNLLGKEINEKVMIEKQLQNANNMLQLVMDSVPQYIFWKDKESKYLGCNSNFLKVAGLSNVEEIVGKDDYDMPWAESEADAYRDDDRKVMQTDIAMLHIHETQHTAEGSLIYVETNKIPLHDDEGNVIGVLGAFEDITTRKMIEQELIASKEQADKSNKAKSEFLSRMSHELRTPLNAILGFAQLLVFDKAHPLVDDQKDSVNEILTAGNHLLRLINEVLDLSRIESGIMEVNKDKVNIIQSIVECISLVSRTAKDRNITIYSHIDQNGEIFVTADTVRLKQVLLNLTGNAIKYNKENGEIDISLELENDDFIKVIIKDTGYGMSEDNLQRLFTPFDRLGQDSNEIEGTGIGLVITRDLVRMMGGEVGVESVQNQGATFWFSLPRYK